MATKKPIPFTGPVPGMGMTSELGSRPWQKPPKYSTVEEVLDFYMSKIMSPEGSMKVLDMLEMGAPVTTVANSIQTLGIFRGLHTIDAGVLVTPALMELIALVADEAGIDYEMGTEEKVDSDMVDEGAIRVALRKFKDEKKSNVEEEDMSDTSLQELLLEDEENLVPPKGGLMARRS